MPEPSRSPDDPKPIADAASLFDTDEVRVINPPASASPPSGPTPASPSPFDTDEIMAVIPPTPARPPAHPTPAPAEPDDGYGLIGGPPEVAEEEPPRPVELPTPEKKLRRRAVAEDGPAAATRRRPLVDEDDEPEAPRRRRRRPAGSEDEDEAVADPLWSRWAEWGGTLVRVGAVLLGTLFVAGMVFRSGYWSLAFVVSLVGMAAAVLLSYPILITMERPVRVTPEQAVKDFYAAASHHFPHYKRMWLLLSSAGRDSGPFRSFDDFRSAWQRQIAAWKGDRASKYAPLDFRVQDFRADKSVGQTSVWAEYTLRVRLRKQEGQDTGLASIRMSHGLVKGDDRMWYLNRGLPTSSDGD